MSHIKLSIVICTLNRIELLTQVVNKLLILISSHKEIELLVIDNDSKDSTFKDTSKLCINYTQLRVFKEYEKGLSHARNRGVQEAEGDWIFFIDDDGMPDDNLIIFILGYIAKDSFKIIGGKYFPWYYYGREKWMKDRYYGNYPELHSKEVLKGDRRLSGGILLIKKSLFNKVGYFNTELGMIGSTIGYSEETEFQDRLIKLGVELLFDPQLKMFHVVAKGKMKVSWFFQSKKALAQSLYCYKYKGDYKYLFLSPFIALGLSLKDSFRNFGKLISSQDYYIQNYIIDSYSKPFKWMHIFLSYFINRE